MKRKKIKGRVYTYSVVSGDLPALNFTRFGIYKTPFISSGNRSRDRIEYNDFLEDKTGYTLKDFPDYELHHHIDGSMMLVPYEIHRIPHLGFIGAKKASSFYF